MWRNQSGDSARGCVLCVIKLCSSAYDIRWYIDDTTTSLRAAPTMADLNNTCGSRDHSRRKIATGPAEREGERDEKETKIASELRHHCRHCRQAYIVVGRAAQAARFALDALPSILFHRRDHVVRELQTRRMRRAAAVRAGHEWFRFFCLFVLRKKTI